MTPDEINSQTPTITRDRELIEAAHKGAELYPRDETSVGLPGPAPRSDLTFAAPPAGSFPGYEILREIHRGGQGIVYQAVQKSTRKRVAIKVMREGPFATPSDRARFEREVQILAQLKHPNIVTIHDSGSATGGSFYVMDYISGQPLDVHVASRKRTVGELLRLFVCICEAVNAAHVRGVTHRDLKPGNILIGPDEEPHILDFGLSKTAAGTAPGDPGAQPVSVTGQFIGSLPWAAPEQAEGSPDKIDLRTDVYSLGVVLYQMLTGRFPYEVVGQLRDVLNNILNAEPARPSTNAGVRSSRIDNEVETIVLKCLSKERERRYQSAGDLAADIVRYLNGEAIVAKRDSAWYVIRKVAARNATASAVAGLVFLILLGCVYVSGYYFHGYRDAQLARLERERMLREQDRLIQGAKQELEGRARHMAFGWFLLNWHAGRVERARTLAQDFEPQSAERKSADFLLDPNISFPQLVAAMPAGHQALALFVEGERQARAGHIDEAIKDFQSVAATGRDKWLQSESQARLAQLAAADGPHTESSR